MKFIPFLIALIFPFMGSTCEIDSCFDIFMGLIEGKEVKLTKPQREAIWKKMEWHQKEGINSLKDARDRSFYIPSLKIRDIVREAIKGAIVTVPKASCQACVIAITLSICAEAGAQLYDEYNKVQDLIMGSKYNLEMADFLREILRRDALA